MTQVVGIEPEHHWHSLSRFLQLGSFGRPSASIAELEADLSLGSFFAFVILPRMRRGPFAIDIAEEMRDTRHEVGRDISLPS